MQKRYEFVTAYQENIIVGSGAKHIGTSIAIAHPLYGVKYVIYCVGSITKEESCVIMFEFPTDVFIL
jgi:hypothetical protein